MRQKACDHCYSRKRSCVVRPGCSKCVRCENLSRACTTSRRQTRSGRPPKKGLNGVATGSLGVWDYALSDNTSPGDDSLSDRSSSVKETDRNREEDSASDQSSVAGKKEQSPLTLTFPGVGRTFENECFYLQLDIYMIGSTFAKDFQEAVEFCRHNSAGLLDEIFRALDSCLSWARFGLLTADQVDVKSGALSVGKLRNVTITHSHDALAVLMLGQALAAFDLLVVSTSTISILRFSLSLARPWYPDFVRSRLHEPIVVAPVFWDTLWCLLHREIPVVSPQFRAGLIDRIAGFCTSLLPILYDLCVVGKELKDGTAEQMTLKSIEHRIETWAPDISDLCSEKYSELEILSMHTQAAMYRTSALLLIHRLRHPFTFEDSTAVALANDILETRSRFFANAPRDATLQNASFPLFLALLEIPISLEGLWQSATRLRTRPACADRLFDFCRRCWDLRHSGFNGSLFDIIDNAPELVPVP